MKHKLFALLAAGLMLTMTGCSLAREPAAGNNAESGDGDRFVGVYVVRDGRDAILDRTNWVDYGSVAADTEWGQIDVPRQILVAGYDEEDRSYTFPGLEGFELFAVTTYEDGVLCTSSFNSMGDGSVHVTATDAGNSYELSGTVYYGAPLDDPDYDPWEDDRVWHMYKVFQMEDGTVYLDGSGDACNGGAGGVTVTQTETRTATANGEEEEVYTKVAVRLEYVERLISLTVRQYDADGRLLQSEELPVEGELPAVNWLPEAAWCVVEELRGEEGKRTAYDRPAEGEEPVFHQVVLLDDEGLGYGAGIQFE